MTKERKEELISGYRLYAENIINIIGRNLSDYRFASARFGTLESDVTAGSAHPIVRGNTLYNWFRIPSLDFDKDSYIYLYHYNSYSDIIINVLMTEDSPKFIDIRYFYIGG